MNAYPYPDALPPKQQGRYGQRATPRAFVFASDPQYPWTPASDDGLEQSNAARDLQSQALIKEQYSSIAEYRQHRGGVGIPVMINGDMTAFGHGWQREFVHPTLKTLLNDNYYFGLGNHDYQNNIDDTFNNGAARDSILDLVNHHQARVDAFDLQVESNEIRDLYSGSLAYSQSFGQVRLIQLNNEPTYRTQFTSGWAWPVERHYRFVVVDSLDWLEQQLQEAHSHGQTVLLNLHKPDDWDGSRDEAMRFKAMIRHYRVSALFAGHLHKEPGAFYRGHYGQVPIYLSGSASQSTYLLAELDDDGRAMSVKLVSRNDWRAAEVIDRLALY
ncbi:metallophosphoesterase family protein [Pseudomonas sp.]|uniref:metallophosphoesterase family protein n=1 Tax=Pseudomonas sp. TaxID=306 RepID=UPI0028AC0EAD|nr:metallophosphoesterase [Pseudomonas sp.]